MRILTVASPWQGGSGMVAFRLARYLAHRQNTTSYFLSYDHPPMNTREHTPLITEKTNIYSYPLFPFPLMELSLTEQIVHFVSEKNIDIIHAHYGIVFGHAGLFAKEALRVVGTKVSLLTTFHGTDIVGFDMVRKGIMAPIALNTLLIKNSDTVSFVSEDLRQKAEHIYGNTAPSYITQNAVDTDMFSPSPVKTEQKRLIHISNFRKVKQPVSVIDIFEQVVRDHEEATLLFVGEGPELEMVRARAEKSPVRSHISYAGRMDEHGVIASLRASDILLLPSLYESFSLVALEAHACGVSVIASRVGGINEVVDHGKTGYLIENPSDVPAFARAVQKLFADPVQLRRFKQQARERALHFAEDIIYPKYTEIYETLK